MKKQQIKIGRRELVLLIIGVILFLTVISSIIDLAAPDCAYSQWFNNIIDIRDAFNKLQTRLQFLIRGIILSGIVYCIGYFVRWILSKIMEKSNRAKTVINIFYGFVKYACAFAIVFILLWACGVDTTALWASAGILALVVGLGCQSLIADIIAGLFIIFEKEYQVGEIIVVDGFRGTVKEVGIRSTKILDAAGDIKIINNSDIKNIVNLSRELSLAVCECGIEYRDSIERVEHILSIALPEMKEKIPEIVDGPFYKGISELSASSVVIKIIAKCHEEDRYQVQRDLNRELKLVFDNNDVNIPFPQIVLNQPADVSDKTFKDVKNQARRFVDKQKSDSANMDRENT